MQLNLKIENPINLRPKMNSVFGPNSVKKIYLKKTRKLLRIKGSTFYWLTDCSKYWLILRDQNYWF